jgi:hypothetical protein
MDFNSAREFDQADAARLRPALEDVTAVVRRRIHRPWTRAWQSEAANDLAATENLQRHDATPWGPNPVSTVITVTQMLLDAVVQHVHAVQLLLEDGGDVVLTIDTTTRAALEAAGQLWWLLERGLTGRERVARLYAQQRATAVELEKVLDKMGLSGAPGHGAMPAELDKYLESELGLIVRRKADKNGVLHWSSCEKQSMPDYTTRVRNFMRDGLGHSPESGPYAYYCGASHSEVWRLQYGYVGETALDGTVRFERRAAAVTLNMAASVCMDTLVAAAARSYQYVGDGAGRTELSLRILDLRNAARMR